MHFLTFIAFLASFLSRQLVYGAETASMLDDASISFAFPTLDGSSAAEETLIDGKFNPVNYLITGSGTIVRITIDLGSVKHINTVFI